MIIATVEDFQADIDAVAAIHVVPTILDVICGVTGMGFAAVARVTEERWITCGVRDDVGFGLVPGSEMKIETTICNMVRASGEPLAINHVAEDPVYKGHPTPEMYGFQSYISVPIVLESGETFGTLCAIDRKPALLDKSEVIGMFKLFAELIAHHLDTGLKLKATQQALLAEQKAAETREMFVAILGHDLRNPLAAISSGLRLIGRTPLNDRASMVTTMMEQSVERMSELIANVLDFTRGRLLGGIEVQCNTAEPLAPVLQHVVSELRTTWPDRVLIEQIDLAEQVMCDRGRIAQILSNLLSNAIAYGAPDQPIRVTAGSAGGWFKLSVCNAGPAIPAEMMEHLFDPFHRGRPKGNRRGLGLGLHIADEIARAHGGVLAATSSCEQTCFTFEMPNVAADAATSPALLELEASPAKPAR